MDDDAIKARAMALCAEWQERLRLLDWKIRLRLTRYSQMPEYPDRQEGGHLAYHRHDKSAEMDVLHPDDAPASLICELDMEHTIVHELLHLHLGEWDPERDTHQYWECERAINLIADALLALKRGEQKGDKR